MDPKKIFIADYIPSLNKGEAAILYGIVDTFKEFSNVEEIYLWSSYPNIDKPRFHDVVKIVNAKSLSIGNKPAAVKISKSFLIIIRYLLFIVLYKIFGKKITRVIRHEVWTAYVDSDLVIAAHDDTLAGPRLSLACVLNILVCIFLRKKSVIYAVSMGFYKSSISQFLVKFLFRNVNLITFREKISYRNCEQMIGSLPNMHVTMDPAFLIRSASVDRIEELLADEAMGAQNKPIIGISVAYGSPVFKMAFSGFNNVKDKYNKHVEIISKIVFYLTKTLNTQVVFIPHVIGPEDIKDDKIISYDIYRRLNKNRMVSIIKNEYSPQEIKGIMGRFDLFIGERLHAVFNAISMGVPSIVVSFPNDYRASGIIGEALDEYRLLYNIEYLQYDSFIEKINEIWNIRGQVKSDLLIKMKKIRENAFLNGILIRDLLNK